MLCLIIIGIVFTSCNAEGNMIQTLESPDGKHVAYLFERNAGATARFTYRLTILKEEVEFKFTNGNTYSSYQMFEIEWVDADTLMVINDDAKDIFYQCHEVGEIKILYYVLSGI